MKKIHSLTTYVLVLASVFLLNHCASYDFSHRVVQQGNLLPQSKIERLRIGMSKQDTAVLMGTSLLSPMFHLNRWDYAYSVRKGNSPLAIRNLSLYFANDRLIRMEHHP